MPAYDFALILDRDPTSESSASALFTAGCDDGTPCFVKGIPMIDFTREAESVTDAVASAVGHVRAAGFAPESVLMSVDTFLKG